MAPADSIKLMSASRGVAALTTDLNVRKMEVDTKAKEVVLDKSYLHQVGPKKMAEFCSSHQGLMPESLFYELLTTSPEKRARCFRNLPRVKNPLVLVKNVGSILRSEVEKRAPFVDIKNASIDIRYVFNRKLVNPHHKFTNEQRYSISEWKKDISSRIEDFKQKAAVVSGWFPKIKGFKAGSNPQPIEEAKQLVCRDSDVVRKIYDQIRDQAFPPTTMLDERWGLFREIQVYVLAALDYVFRNGDNSPYAVSTKIENEYLDLEYCITAVLVGALASQDKRMIARFRSIRPDGFVLCQDS